MKTNKNLKELIENHLICDRTPTQEMIDYKVEKYVYDVISEFQSGANWKEEMIVLFADDLKTSFNASFLTSIDCVEETVKKIEKSFSRCYPYVTFKIPSVQEIIKSYKNTDKKWCYVSAECTLHITKQMKQKILLDRKIKEKMPISNEPNKKNKI